MSPQESREILGVPVSAELKRIIERAAAYIGQTVEAFATVALVEEARCVIEQHECTKLSQRDGHALLKVIDDESAEPNAALVKAAQKYKRWRAEL